MVNPLGSQDPKDFKTNVGNLDKAVNQTSSDKWNDRFGVERFSWRGLENKVDAALARIAFNVPIDYVQGLLVSSNGFTVEYEGVVYAPQPSNVPFTTGVWDASQWYPIQNVFTQNNLLVFDDYASAQAAAATLPDGQVVEALVNGATLRYVVSAGSLVKIQAHAGDGPLNVREFIETQIDGVTSNQEGIVAAVAAAYAIGAQLEWPAGVYVSDANIPNFHDVQHTGSGIVKRGSDLFYPNPTDAQTNSLYVSTSGSTTNDGLTASHPLTLSAAVSTVLPKYGPTLSGTWRVVLAAGTYAGGVAVTGIRSKKRIIIEGPNVGGHPNVPTAIISGSGGESYGLYFQNYMFLQVQNIKFENFTAGNSAAGLICDYHSNLYTINVHAQNCTWAGINCNNSVKLFVSGGVFDGNRKGIRVYANSMISFGYGGSSALNRPQITNSTEYGVEVRDCSTGHVDYCDISGSAIAALHVWNHSRVASDGVAFLNNNVGVWCDSFSTWGTATTCTFTSNGKDKVFYWSTDSSKRDFYYDDATGRFRFGTAGYTTPATKFFFAGGAASSGASYNSNARMALDSEGNTYFGLSAPPANSAGIVFSTVGAANSGLLAYQFSDNSMRITLNGADTYRMKADSFIAVADNAKTLGEASLRWSVVYAGTGTINTSDARAKQQIRELSEAERAVAVRLKSLIRAFKFNDAVESKGDKARIHVGVIAQDVKAAFESEGLVAEDYGVLCYDEWAEQPDIQDDEGNVVQEYRAAGSRYGIRYDELAMFILAAM